jgi:di/tricarboxylate transporter
VRRPLRHQLRLVLTEHSSARCGLHYCLFAGQLSNVMGCLTTYGIGSAPPFYGTGYVPQAKWYQLGFIFSVLYLSVWLFVGGAWWKAIGIF